MSDLLNQASLVMVPSGYKEDTVYSVVPTNGNGDLSFTRASNGTRVNSAGLVEVCPWNLLQQSETFDNAAWSKTGATVTANDITAPNGTLTADKIVFSGANKTINQSVNIDGAISTRFVYVKGTAGETISIDDIFTSQPNITLTGDWQLVGFTSATPNGYGFGISTYGGATARTIWLWGAQLNIGSTAKPYFPTTDRLNVPRLTYQNGGGGCPSLLLEKQSTNLLTYSEQFDNAAWSKSNVTITANNTTSPDGTQNADLATATSGGELLQGLVLNTSTSYTFSFYVKKGTATDAKYRVYNFDAGVNVVSPISYISQTNTSTWVRVSVSFTSSATGVNYGIYLLDSASAGTMYFWGAQMEASSYVTSYIQSTSSSATRVADACSKTGISSLIGQTEGTLFMDMVPTIVSGQGRYMNIFNSSNVNNGWNGIISSGSTPNTFRFYGDGFDFSGGACLFGVRVKVALAYKNGVLTSAYVNGASVGTLTAVTTGKSYNQLTLGEGPFGLEGSCNVNEAVIFPTALTNAELASLTTI